MKKNIYMVQANYLHGNSTYFPYAAGTLIASAQRNAVIKDAYNFGEIFFLRENTDAVLERMESPSVVAFSNYIWNYEYNKLLAAKLRKKHPECIIIFGGHHISCDAEAFEDCPDADYFIFGEGEEVFTQLLCAIHLGEDVSSVPNIACRKNGEAVVSFRKCMTGTDYPSPYLEGCFDEIIEKHPELKFYAIIETSRGCPYKCKYCDWGNLDSARVKFFPAEKIYAELEWLGSHGVDTFGGADANFGIVKRDEEIIDRMTQIHNRTGHLKNFQTSYAKNSNDIVFNMTKKLNDCGMNKGVTLSFQSLSEAALKNVGRENISIESYKALLRRYALAGISTYTELILGLPGETYESFVSGIDTLLESGQHHAIYIHNCEYLPSAGMSDREYTRKYNIGVSKIPLNQPHREANAVDEVEEYSKIVTSTYSMCQEDWIRMNIFSCAVQCFHHGGLLPFFAIYLHNEKGIAYSDFYKSLVDFISKDKNSIAGKAFAEVESMLRSVISENGRLTFEDERFGNVIWPAEEYAFLDIVCNADKFYDEIRGFLSAYLDAETENELERFQRMMLKVPSDKDATEEFSFNFYDYFTAVYRNEKQPLKKEKCICRKNVAVSYDSIADYARFSVWYGRKEFGNLNLSTAERVEN